MATRLQMSSSSVNNYVTDRELGQGGFGCAFLVNRQSDDNQFVMKDIHLSRLARIALDDTKDRTEIIKFARKEADLMASITQPNIVRVVEAFEDGDHFYIIMEYCDSGTLKDAIKARKGELFPEPQIRSWTAQLALTIKYLHDRKILHRDIKTENVFLTSGGRVIKLGDFGIAKSLERADQSAYTGVGTVAYTAPEHCEGRGYSHKSEVWSFGVVIYELAALHLPFRAPDKQGANYMMLFIKICKTEPEPFPDKYSSELNELVCEKMLAKSPEKRPSMADVIGHPCITETLAGLTALGATVHPALTRTSPGPFSVSNKLKESTDQFNQATESDSALSPQLANGIQVIMESAMFDDLYKRDICSAMKEHKLTLDMLKELTDEELAEMFPQIGPRKAVKKFVQQMPEQKNDSEAASSEDLRSEKEEQSSDDHQESFDFPKPQLYTTASEVGKKLKLFWKGPRKMRRAASDFMKAKALQVIADAAAGLNITYNPVIRSGSSSGNSEFHSIYSPWSINQPKEPFQVPSLVIAILLSRASSKQQNDGSLIVTLVCAKGEILSSRLSNEDSCETHVVEWEARLRLPANQSLNYAAIEAGTDDIYFTLFGDPQNRDIFTVNRNDVKAAAARRSQIGNFVDTKRFVSTDDWNFVGLAVDNHCKTLLACAPRQGGITLWCLQTALHLGTVNCQTLQHGVHPYCCAVYSSSKTKRTYLAVSDTMENCISLFVRDGCGANTPFLFANLVACCDQGNPTAIGSVFWPNDVTFDSDGNLIVSDSENRRFQVFATLTETATTGKETTTSHVLWTSKEQRSCLSRIAVISNNPVTCAATNGTPCNRPLAVVALKSTTESSPVLWFE